MSASPGKRFRRNFGGTRRHAMFDILTRELNTHPIQRSDGLHISITPSLLPVAG